MVRGAPFFLLMVLRVRRLNSTITSTSLVVRVVNSVSSDEAGWTSFPNIFFIFSNMVETRSSMFLIIVF